MALGYLYRKFYRHANSSTLLQLYLAYVRPHLEYAAAVWDPHQQGHITSIESVQKFVAGTPLSKVSWHLSLSLSLSTLAQCEGHVTMHISPIPCPNQDFESEVSWCLLSYTPL